jgi:hypothetical protein
MGHMIPLVVECASAAVILIPLEARIVCGCVPLVIILGIACGEP